MVCMGGNFAKKKVATSGGQRPGVGHEREVADPCKHVDRLSGQACGQSATPGAILCVAHLKSFLSHAEQKFVKCRDCVFVTSRLDKDGQITPAIIEQVHDLDCHKAFWYSKGDEKRMLKDLCYWDTEALLRPVDSPEDALEEMKVIIDDLKLRRSQLQRLLVKEGGEVTPLYLQLTDRLTDLLKDYVELKRGKQGFGRPGSHDAGLAGQGEKQQFLKMLVEGKDGYEDGIKVTKTETLEVAREKKPQIHKLVVEGAQQAAPPPLGSPLGRTGPPLRAEEGSATNEPDTVEEPDPKTESGDPEDAP